MEADGGGICSGQQMERRSSEDEELRAEEAALLAPVKCQILTFKGRLAATAVGWKTPPKVLLLLQHLFLLLLLLLGLLVCPFHLVWAPRLEIHS